jgi:hypothetical protein
MNEIPENIHYSPFFFICLLKLSKKYRDSIVMQMYQTVRVLKACQNVLEQTE